MGTATRHRIKALLGAGYPKVEIARLMGVSLRTVQRIDKEPDVAPGDDAAERRRRRIGRPSVIRQFEGLIRELLEADPEVKSIRVLRRAQEQGYGGGKTTMYAFVARLRAETALRHRKPSEQTRPSLRGQTTEVGPNL